MSKETSQKIAEIAGRLLNDPDSSDDVKAVAASVLSQRESPFDAQQAEFFKQSKLFCLKAIIFHENVIEFNQMEIQKHKDMAKLLDERIEEIEAQ